MTARTDAAILQLNGVGEVGRAAVGRVAAPGLVVSDELGINVDRSDVVDNAANLEALRVLQEVAQHRGFACVDRPWARAMRTPRACVALHQPCVPAPRKPLSMVTGMGALPAMVVRDGVRSPPCRCYTADV